MPIQLHVFEERYKLMMDKILNENRSFGVVLIDEGQEALGPLAKPHEIGCVARITQVEKLEHGSLNLNSFGTERFKITSLIQESPFLIAAVEPFPLQTIDPIQVEIAVDRLKPFLRKYLLLLAEFSEAELDLTRIPDAPKELAYIACYLVQTSPEQKQLLLETETTDTLLDSLRSVYRREIALLRVMTDHPNDIATDSVPFSEN
jgi:Lon protease-like protein